MQYKNPEQKECAIYRKRQNGLEETEGLQEFIVGVAVQKAVEVVADYERSVHYDSQQAVEDRSFFLKEMRVEFQFDDWCVLVHAEEESACIEKALQVEEVVFVSLVVSVRKVLGKRSENLYSNLH